jgi:hypothetical protein
MAVPSQVAHRYADRIMHRHSHGRSRDLLIAAVAERQRVMLPRDAERPCRGEVPLHRGCGWHDGGMGEDEKLRFDLQKEVARDLFAAVRDSLNSLQRTLQIGVALVAALFAAAFARGVYAVFLFAPLALGLLICYQSQVYSDLMVLAWQREQVLREIRRHLGQDILGRDVGITRHGRSNPSIVISQASYFMHSLWYLRCGFLHPSKRRLPALGGRPICYICLSWYRCFTLQRIGATSQLEPLRAAE